MYILAELMEFLLYHLPLRPQQLVPDMALNKQLLGKRARNQDELLLAQCLGPRVSSFPRRQPPTAAQLLAAEDRPRFTARTAAGMG